MKKIEARCLSALLLLSILCPEPALCCSLIAKPPVTSFDASEFVFTGRAIKLVGPFSTELSSTTYGIEAIVDQSINLPTPSKSYLVFKFRHNSMCGPKVENQETLQKLIGHRFRFVARPLDFVRLKEPPSAAPALQIGSYGGELLQQVDESLDAQLPASLDYRKIAEWNGQNWTDPLHWYAVGRAGYDLRSELLRLKENGSQTARAGLVGRMAYHPQFIDRDPSFVQTFIRENLVEPESTKVLNGFNDWAVKRLQKRLNRLSKTPAWQHSEAQKILLGYLDSMNTSKAKAVADKYRAKGE